MSVNLEDDAPAPPAPDPEPVSPEPVAAAPAPPADPDDMDPGDLVDAEKAKGLIGAVKALRHETKELKQRAAESDQLRQQLAQAQGALGAFQHLRDQMQQPQAPQQPVQSDPELIELARSLDYYKADGTPDLERAQKHDVLIQKRASRIAQQMIAPMQQQTSQAQSLTNYQRALATKTPDGQQASKETIDWMFSNLPSHLTADPRVAQVLPALGLGLDILSGKKTSPVAMVAPPAGPPIHTEASGGGPARARAVMSDVERAITAARGMPDKRYAELTKDYRPGRPSVLEDD